MEASYRKLTRQQREELQGYIAWGTTAFRFILFLGGLFLVGAIFRFLQSLASKVWPGASSHLWWVVPTLILGVALYRRSRAWTGGTELREKVRNDLSRDVAAVYRIAVKEALQIEEREDEGPGFFLRTADDRTMLFAGQYLEKYVRKGFPWTAFEIIESPESKMLLGLKSLGDRLEPLRRRSPLSWEEARQSGILKKKYVFIDGDASSIWRADASQG
jgi:hypothetical protein